MRRTLAVAAVALIAGTGIVMADERMDAFRDGIERAHQRLPKIDYRDHKPDAPTMIETPAQRSERGILEAVQRGEKLVQPEGISDKTAHENQPVEIVARLVIGGLYGHPPDNAYFPFSSDGIKTSAPVRFDRLSAKQRAYLSEHCDAELPCVAHWKVAAYVGGPKNERFYFYYLLDWR